MSWWTRESATLIALGAAWCVGCSEHPAPVLGGLDAPLAVPIALAGSTRVAGMIPWECQVDIRWCAAGWNVPQIHEPGAHQVQNSTPFLHARKGVRIGMEPRFFPGRPSSAVLHTHSGILEDFGAGMAMGHVALRTRSGTIIDFYLGSEMRINGTPMRCARPSECTAWPPRLITGRSWVTVTHWTMTFHGNNVRVTDEIDY
jgi:hypothetical protein